MAEVDIHSIKIKCENCGNEIEVDAFAFPVVVDCCDSPEYASDEVDITTT